METLAGLLHAVTLLICECAFLAADAKKARLSRHLCTSDFNMIIDRLRPLYVLPMHLYKARQEKSHHLYDKIEPPQGVTVLKIPDRLTPRPLMTCELARGAELNL
jgi:ribonuclease Z